MGWPEAAFWIAVVAAIAVYNIVKLYRLPPGEG
jgi:hypothetical protein